MVEIVNGDFRKGSQGGGDLNTTVNTSEDSNVTTLPCWGVNPGTNVDKASQFFSQTATDGTFALDLNGLSTGGGAFDYHRTDVRCERLAHPWTIWFQNSPFINLIRALTSVKPALTLINPQVSTDLISVSQRRTRNPRRIS